MIEETTTYTRSRLETVRLDWLSPAQAATYAYDNAGRLTSLTNFNGSVTSYGYDNANRLTSLDNKKSDASVIAAYSYALNAIGNITQSVQDEPLEPVFTAGTTSYTYNAQKTRLLSAGSDGFTYDNEGQLATGYGSTYTFDYGHKLTAISGAFNAQYFYDGKGNRLKAIRDGITTKYIYDMSGNLLAEADINNAITKYYIHGSGLLAMVTLADSVYTYHFNNIGTTIAMTDSSQNVVNKYGYDEFGNVLNQVEAISQPFKYVGKYGVMAEPNGFYYMRARYYDPKVGRFVSEDPIGFEGKDANLMRYVGNNAVNFTDPKGLKVEICYEPTSNPFLNALRARHASIETTQCGRWGFYPAEPILRNQLYGPGIVIPEPESRLKVVPGLECLSTQMTKCADEACVCSKIRDSALNPPNFGMLFFTCNSWARKIISECQKR